MCGVVGTVSHSPVNQLLYDALLLLQHRGQDAAGIATMNGNSFTMHKANGLVRDVFRTRNMRSLVGNAGIGQVRYPTAGNALSEEEAQRPLALGRCLRPPQNAPHSKCHHYIQRRPDRSEHPVGWGHAGMMQVGEPRITAHRPYPGAGSCCQRAGVERDPRGDAIELVEICEHVSMIAG